METKEYRSVDKTGWMKGPWMQEPDKMQWRDETSGLPCLIVRGPSGALCGYVGVDESHPWHGKGYSADKVGACGEGCSEDYHYECSIQAIVRVHGGLTFADACSPGAEEARGICHVPAPGEPDHVWWFGFDCAHAGDHSPMYEKYFKPCPWEPSGHCEYRDIAYVKEQVSDLAAQLASRR